MQQCLDKLVHERFAAVVIDRKLADADVLELILNVRDIDKTTPVAVIGRGKDEHIERKIIDQDHTIVLAEIEKVETLARRLSDAIKVNKDENT
jgi:DNA-binding NtrC family response regulator